MSGGKYDRVPLMKESYVDFHDSPHVAINDADEDVHERFIRKRRNKKLYKCAWIAGCVFLLVVILTNIYYFMPGPAQDRGSENDGEPRPAAGQMNGHQTDDDEFDYSVNAKDWGNADEDKDYDEDDEDADYDAGYYNYFFGNDSYYEDNSEYYNDDDESTENNDDDETDEDSSDYTKEDSGDLDYYYDENSKDGWGDWFDGSSTTDSEGLVDDSDESDEYVYDDDEKSNEEAVIPDKGYANQGSNIISNPVNNPQQIPGESPRTYNPASTVTNKNNNIPVSSNIAQGNNQNSQQQMYPGQQAPSRNYPSQQSNIAPASNQFPNNPVNPRQRVVDNVNTRPIQSQQYPAQQSNIAPARNPLPSNQAIPVNPDQRVVGGANTRPIQEQHVPGMADKDGLKSVQPQTVNQVSSSNVLQQGPVQNQNRNTDTSGATELDQKAARRSCVDCLEPYNPNLWGYGESDRGTQAMLTLLQDTAIQSKCSYYCAAFMKDQSTSRST